LRVNLLLVIRIYESALKGLLQIGNNPQYIEEIWLKQTGKSLTIDELTQQKERIWLLLDGLDEMTSRVEIRHVSTLLGGWVQDARVVVTCRVNVNGSG
jgi:predicted NACHT family NTPase